MIKCYIIFVFRYVGVFFRFYGGVVCVGFEIDIFFIEGRYDGEWSLDFCGIYNLVISEGVFGFRVIFVIYTDYVVTVRF